MSKKEKFQDELLTSLGRIATALEAIAEEQNYKNSLLDESVELQREGQEITKDTNEKWSKLADASFPQTVESAYERPMTGIPLPESSFSEREQYAEDSVERIKVKAHAEDVTGEDIPF